MTIRPIRRHDIDALRVWATLAVFLFHCARYFNDEDWHVKNPEPSFAATVFVGVLNQWIMPLFFVLSGIGVSNALASRSDGEYLRERVARLLVPLGFGIFALAAPQVWIERLSHGEFQGSLLAFIPRFFDGFYGFGGNFAWMGLHLWYLEMLFIFSVLTLPFFRRAASREAPQGSFGRALLLWFIAIAAIESLVNLSPEAIGRRDFGGWSPPVYLAIFCAAFTIGRDPRSREQIARLLPAWSAGAVLLTLIGYVLVRSGFSTYSISFSILRAANMGCWVLMILGWGTRCFSEPRAWFKPLIEAAMPFYCLHQTVIVAIGFAMLDWPAPFTLKYAALAISSFVVVVAIYAAFIRPIPLARRLFGMKG